MRAVLFGVLALLFSCMAFAADDAPADYDLHEWGVFSVSRNAKWTQIDMAAEWATLPDFFHRQRSSGEHPPMPPMMGGVAAPKKPVIFIHARKPGHIDLQVVFAEGRPAVWWPLTQPSHRDRLIFSLDVDAENSAATGGGQPPPVPATHWIQPLRAVKASMLDASFHSGKRVISEAESFIYYDGIMKAPATPVVERRGAAVSIKNPHDFEMLDVMAVERDAKQVRISEWGQIKPGETSELKLRPAVATGQEEKLIAALGAEFTARLISAGLNKLEAQALEQTWHKGLFERDGLLLFYRVPQAIYDKWLPLNATPAPKSIVRVGIVYHEHLEPELDANLAALIKSLGSGDFNDREAAQKKLLEIGGAAFPALEAHFKDADPEIANRCRMIVKTLDARAAAETPADKGAQHER